MTCCEARKAVFQLADIGTDLRVPPSLFGLSDDLTEVGFRRRRQEIGGGQARLLPPSYSSIISVMLVEETLPARPSETLSSSKDFNSCHA